MVKFRLWLVTWLVALVVSSTAREAKETDLLVVVVRVGVTRGGVA